jgi:hypothetical protein
MPLWGATDADESKPKNLTIAEKKQVFAKAGGWVAEPAMSGNGNASATPEVLVAIRNLAVKVGAADITEIEFITTAIAADTPAALSVRVRFNEAVDVTGAPQLTVTNDSNGVSTSVHIVLPYASGTGTNELVFTHTWSSGECLATDVMSIGVNATALNGGTIKDAGTSTVSTITNIEAIGTAAGTITVTAS